MKSSTVPSQKALAQHLLSPLCSGTDALVDEVGRDLAFGLPELLWPVSTPTSNSLTLAGTVSSHAPCRWEYPSFLRALSEDFCAIVGIMLYKMAI